MLGRCDPPRVELLTKDNENEKLNISAGATFDIKKSPEKTDCEKNVI